MQHAPIYTYPVHPFAQLDSAGMPTGQTAMLQFDPTIWAALSPDAVMSQHAMATQYASSLPAMDYFHLVQMHYMFGVSAVNRFKQTDHNPLINKYNAVNEQAHELKRKFDNFKSESLLETERLQNEIAGLKRQKTDEFDNKIQQAKAERDKAVSEAQAAAAERDKAVSEAQAAAVERDKAVSEAQAAAAAERDKAINEAQATAAAERDKAVSEAQATAAAERDKAINEAQAAAAAERDKAINEAQAAAAERDKAVSEAQAAAAAAEKDKLDAITNAQNAKRVHEKRLEIAEERAQEQKTKLRDAQHKNAELEGQLAQNSVVQQQKDELEERLANTLRELDNLRAEVEQGTQPRVGSEDAAEPPGMPVGQMDTSAAEQMTLRASVLTATLQGALLHILKIFDQYDNGEDADDLLAKNDKRVAFTALYKSWLQTLHEWERDGVIVPRTDVDLCKI